MLPAVQGCACPGCLKPLFAGMMSLVAPLLPQANHDPEGPEAKLVAVSCIRQRQCFRFVLYYSRLPALCYAEQCNSQTAKQGTERGTYLGCPVLLLPCAPAVPLHTGHTCPLTAACGVQELAEEACALAVSISLLNRPLLAAIARADILASSQPQTHAAVAQQLVRPL